MKILIFCLLCLGLLYLNTNVANRQHSMQPESSPQMDGVVMTNEAYAGMQIFMMKCNNCHPGARRGAGPALMDKDVPEKIAGKPNEKPQPPCVSVQDISARQLHEISAFLDILRHDRRS